MTSVGLCWRRDLLGHQLRLLRQIETRWFTTPTRVLLTTIQAFGVECLCKITMWSKTEACHRAVVQGSRLRCESFLDADWLTFCCFIHDSVFSRLQSTSCSILNELVNCSLKETPKKARVSTDQFSCPECKKNSLQKTIMFKSVHVSFCWRILFSFIQIHQTQH